MSANFQLAEMGSHIIFLVLSFSQFVRHFWHPNLLIRQQLAKQNPNMAEAVGLSLASLNLPSSSPQSKRADAAL